MVFNQSTIQKRVMRRVYVIYLWRQIMRPRTAKAALLAAGIVAIASVVSLPNVIQNMPGDPLHFLTFLAAAFLGTEVVVQVLSIATIGVAAWLMKDVVSPALARV